MSRSSLADNSCVDLILVQARIMSNLPEKKECRKYCFNPGVLIMSGKGARHELTGCLAAVLAAGAVTAVIHLTHADRSLVTVPLLYLLGIQVVACKYGSRAAIVASLVSFFATDWFFVEPKYAFTINDPCELVALCVFLVTGVTTGQLVALFENRAEEARCREIAATALAESSWIVASELDTRKALSRVLKHLAKIAAFKQACVLLPAPEDVRGFSLISGAAAALQEPDLLSVNPSAVKNLLSGNIAGAQSAGFSSCPALPVPELYLPVIMDGQCQAVLFVELSEPTGLKEADWQVVESISNHVAVVLQRDRLVKDKADAQALVETDRLKTALLQMVSHDFRNPLASIKVNVSSLYDDVGEPLDGETRRELLNSIESQTDRLNKMVGNILDLSRLKSGTWAPRRELTTVADLIGTTLDSCNSEQNKRIKVKLDRSVSEIYVDPVQIVQVLKNLIENALKYSTAGSPVNVETEEQAEKSSFVIRVLDRGPGLTAGDEKRIFTPLYRAARYRETSIPGLGMGLAIARGLVEAHGAVLSGQNREGGGAVFEMVFPDSICSQSD